MTDKKTLDALFGTGRSRFRGMNLDYDAEGNRIAVRRRGRGVLTAPDVTRVCRLLRLGGKRVTGVDAIVNGFTLIYLA